MSKRKRILWVAALVIVIGVFALLLSRSSEPSYQGKPLTVWLEQFGTNQWRHKTNDLQIQAQTAVQHVGTRAVPTCLKLMNAKVSQFRLKLTSLVPWRWRERLHVSDNFAYQRKVRFKRELGSFGFEALGTEAGPFIPEIEKLLKEKDPEVRNNAVFTLGELGPIASNAVPSLIDCLQDADPNVKFNAFGSLAKIHQRPGLVVPIAISYVDSKDMSLRIPGLLALEHFGPTAKSAVPHLLPLLNDTVGNVGMLAAHDILIIDPEAAAKAGIKPP